MYTFDRAKKKHKKDTSTYLLSSRAVKRKTKHTFYPIYPNTKLVY